ncbi:hypothetical protein [Actinomadura sp. GTD37]|uniref:hypothetical protein n=1 Tax=Actinomadura sp. GTD37 TaxID=1778030 RepID=UPI0035C1D508
MSEAGRAALRRGMAAAEALSASEPPPAVTEAIDRYHRLMGIPFDHIVPDPALLPEESVRFFIVDGEWLEALTEGVLSVGGTGSRASALAARHTELYRSRMRTAAASGPVAGMLLRSTLVAQWPTAQVLAFADPVPPRDAKPAGLHPIVPLRFEALAPTLLLVLWPRVPSAVWIEEPHRELGHGFHVDPQSGGLVVPPAPNTSGANVPVRMRAPQTVDIVRLAADVAGQPGRGGRAGSGPLAAALLSRPYRQVFE